ncbi:unnamed protein product, partial [marine sediment metagenome]
YHEPWPDKHLRTIEHAYSKAPYFQPFFSRLQAILTQPFDLLQDLNHAVVQLCRSFLDLDGPVSWSSELNITTTDKSERILEVCAAHSADLLYDGKAAADFIDVDFFASNGVRVVFQDYRHPVYPQLWGPFVSHLSAIDLIMNTGPEAPRALRRSPVPRELSVAESVASTGPVDGERSYV